MNSPAAPRRYRLRHVTRYGYDQAIYLEPHVLRLYPRPGPDLQLLSFSLTIHPQPISLTLNHAIGGGGEHFACFDGTTTALEIVAESHLALSAASAFSYLLASHALRLPMTYSPDETQALWPACRRAPDDPEVTALAWRVAAQCDWQPTAFLLALTLELHRSLQHQARLLGPPLPPGETLRRGQGSCRDLAVLFMDCCRCQGLAARFVSGYHDGDFIEGDKDLHAWAEVFLPGAGWRGFDPALGLAVTDRHLPLAADALPALAAPVTGTWRGTANQTLFDSTIELVHLS